MESAQYAHSQTARAPGYAQGEGTVDTGTPVWYAVSVRSRHEFVAHEEMLHKGIDAFLPSVRRASRWRDRTKYLVQPLFPGYVFVHLLPHPEAYLGVLKTRGVVKFVTLGQGAPAPVDPEEMSSLKLLVESGRNMDLYPGLKEGTRVRLRNGPLKDAVGILGGQSGECTFYVNVEMLGRCVSIKVASQDVEAR